MARLQLVLRVQRWSRAQMPCRVKLRLASRAWVSMQSMPASTRVHLAVGDAYSTLQSYVFRIHTG